MATKGRRRRAAYCTARDLQVLEWVGSRGCANAAQLHARFWPGRRPGTCEQRLAQLVAAGYLHTATVDVRGAPERLYWIERKGAGQFAADVRARLYRGRPPRAELAHLLKTGDALVALAGRATLLEVAHEHQLKGRKVRDRLPAQAADAFVRYERDGEITACYLELDGAYYGKMLERKVQELGMLDAPVRWIVYSEKRFQRIAALCRRFAAGNVAPIFLDAL